MVLGLALISRGGGAPRRAGGGRAAAAPPTPLARISRLSVTPAPKKVAHDYAADSLRDLAADAPTTTDPPPADALARLEDLAGGAFTS